MFPCLWIENLLFHLVSRLKWNKISQSVWDQGSLIFLMRHLSPELQISWIYFLISICTLHTFELRSLIFFDVSPKPLMLLLINVVCKFNCIRVLSLFLLKLTRNIWKCQHSDFTWKKKRKKRSTSKLMPSIHHIFILAKKSYLLRHTHTYHDFTWKNN